MRTEVKVGIITALVVIVVVIFVLFPSGNSEGETGTVPFDAPPIPDPTGTVADVRTPTGERTGVATPDRRATEPPDRRESLRTSPPTRADADRQPVRPPAGPPEVLVPEEPDDQPPVGEAAADRDRIGARIDEEFRVTDDQSATTRPADEPRDRAATPVDRDQPEPRGPEPARPPTPGVPVPKTSEASPGTDSPLPGFKPTAGMKRHVISRGDTLWALAEYYYGDGRLHKRILEANPGLNENSLHVGREIVIPPEESFAEKPTGTRPGPTTEPGVRKHTYVVERGDTLIKIARNLLGDDARWRELYELNKDKIANPNVVPVGLELKLPEK